MRKATLIIAAALVVAVGFSPAADAGTNLARDVARALKVAKHADKTARNANRRSAAALAKAGVKGDKGDPGSVGPQGSPGASSTPSYGHVSAGGELDAAHSTSDIKVLKPSGSGLYCVGATRLLGTPAHNLALTLDTETSPTTDSTTTRGYVRRNRDGGECPSSYSFEVVIVDENNDGADQAFYLLLN